MSSGERCRADEPSPVNDAYLLTYVQAAFPSGGAILDFGCGEGELVSLLRDNGFEAIGVDVFYGGAAWDSPALAERLASRVVQRIEPGMRLPFADETFDLVVSNQVLEHVADLAPTMFELSRVLRTSGRMYHHFPTREVIREGHCGIPLAHRIPDGRPRVFYMTAARALGLGKLKKDRPVHEWVSRFSTFLREMCTYRPYAEYRAIFERAGFRVAHFEAEYCAYRWGGRPIVGRLARTRALRGVIGRSFGRLGFTAVELVRVGGDADPPS